MAYWVNVNSIFRQSKKIFYHAFGRQTEKNMLELFIINFSRLLYNMTHLHTYSNAHHHDNTQILLMSFAIIMLFMLVEYVGGYLTHSLALIADAGHMLNDSLGLAIALLALTWVKKWARHLAVVNGLSLLSVAIFVLFEAWQRWQSPSEINSLPMLAIALSGLVANGVVAKIMLAANHNNINIRAAYLHVLVDIAGSVVAIVAGLCAYFWGWQWVDTLASTVLSVLILRSGWGITRNALRELQEQRVPQTD